MRRIRGRSRRQTCDQYAGLHGPLAAAQSKKRGRRCPHRVRKSSGASPTQRYLTNSTEEHAQQDRKVSRTGRAHSIHAQNSLRGSLIEGAHALMDDAQEPNGRRVADAIAKPAWWSQGAAGRSHPPLTCKECKLFLWLMRSIDFESSGAARSWPKGCRAPPNGRRAIT